MERSAKVNWMVGGLVFLVTLVVYLITVADTVSWWDCGEFITCSYTLGVPHPPGAPFYLLVGRVFSLLPVGKEIAYRVNLISPIASALAVLLLYLVTVRLIKLWQDKGRRTFGQVEGEHGKPRAYKYSTLELVGIHTGAAVAALSAAFADTFWFNAVEAEVYGPSVLFTMLGVWLTMVWAEKHEEPNADRILFFIPYLYGLGAGVHLLCLLTVPSIFLIVVFTDLRPLWNWRLWVGVPLLFALGYSTYYVIMVRSSLNPMIDENNPETWRNFMLFLQRKQYGADNAILGMFSRKADFWGYQMGDLFTKYFLQQFPLIFPKITAVFNEATSSAAEEVAGAHDKMLVFVPVIPLALGFGGMIVHLLRDWKRFLAFLALFVIMGFGLVVYLNIADPQPRERDYFFVGAPTIFAIWIGMSATALLAWVRKLFARSGVASPVMVFALSACFLAMPVGFIREGFHTHDRSDDYVAYDYGYNILQTCEQDAILFTNGDNDTFPLWFLQEVAGVRKDVRVVNLSLLNTDWYIKQLRDFEPKVDIRFTDQYIDHVLCGMSVESIIRSGRVYGIDRKKGMIIPWKGREVSTAGLTWTLTAAKGFSILRVQDVMVYKIIEWNNWKKPIYFAVTVARDNKIGLTPYLSMEGMAHRLTTTPGKDRLNVERMRHNLTEVYRYRGLLDDKIYKDSNTMKLLINYRAPYFELVNAYVQEGKGDAALEMLKHAEGHVPMGFEELYWAMEISHRAGKTQESIDYALRCLARLGYRDLNTAMKLADRLRDMDELDRAIETYKEIIARGGPGLVDQANYRMAMAYDKKGDYAQAIEALKYVRKAHPEDSSVGQTLGALEAKLKLQKAQEGKAQKDTAAAQ